MPPKLSSRQHCRKPAPPPAPRPKLTKDELKALAMKMSKAYGWDAPPKEFQLRAVQAQIEGTDMIIQAPTGAGKTAIAAGPYVWGGNEKKFTLMVCPLLALEDEMCVTFDTEFGLKAIALNSKNGACSPLEIRDILALKYQIILISPEMLQSRMFMNRVLRKSAFMRNCLSMVIDEAHCIVLWGTDFRKKYGTLGKVRAFLPRGTPVIALSATLTPRIVRAIWASLHFSHSETQSGFVNEGNDRPNVSIVIRACQHPLNTYADLAFTIPPHLRSINDIPKSYIYVNHIPTGGEIIDYLNKLLENHPDLVNADEQTRAAFRGIIRPFNATLSHHYRNLAMHRFRTGEVRFLVCTDAAGMGCNIPDIDRVVQWKLPSTFSHWIQRAGRAARGRGRTGLAVLLVERSAYNIDLVNTAKVPETSRKSGKTKAAKTSTEAHPKELPRDRVDVREYAIAHGLARGGSSRQDAAPNGAPPILREDSADEGLLAFVQSPSCHRKIWARVFDNPHVLAPTVPCCDICDPTLLNKTRPPPLPPERRSKTLKHGEPDLHAEKKLREWRKSVFARDHQFAQYDHTSILDDDLIVILVSHGQLSAEQASELVQDKWPFYDRHASELGAYIAQLPIEFIAKSRKRATSPGDSSLRDESDAKRPKTAPLLPGSTPATNAPEAPGVSRSVPRTTIAMPTPHASIHARSLRAPPAYSLPPHNHISRPSPLAPPNRPPSVHPAQLQPQPFHLPIPALLGSQPHSMLPLRTTPSTPPQHRSQQFGGPIPPPPPTTHSSAHQYQPASSTSQSAHVYPPPWTPSQLQSASHSPLAINPLLAPASSQPYLPPAMTPSQFDHSFYTPVRESSVHSHQHSGATDTYPPPLPPPALQLYPSTPSRPPSRICPTPTSRQLSNYPPPPPQASMSAFTQPRQSYTAQAKQAGAGMSRWSSQAARVDYPMAPSTSSPLPSLPIYPPSSPSPFTSQLRFAHSEEGHLRTVHAQAPIPDPPPLPNWIIDQSLSDTSDFLDYSALAQHPCEEANSAQFSPSYGVETSLAPGLCPPEHSSPQYPANYTPNSNYDYSMW